MTRLASLFTAAAVLLLVMAWCTPAYSQEPLPEWVTVSPAQDCSQGCWKLVDAYYLPQEQSAGLHHVFARTLDTQGNQIVDRFTVAWADGSVTVDTKAPPDWGDVALFSCFFPDQGEVGGYRAFAGIWEANSDTVSGMALPYCHHVSYYLTWQWQDGTPPTATPPTATPTPAPPPPLPIRLHLPVVGKG